VLRFAVMVSTWLVGQRRSHDDGGEKHDDCIGARTKRGAAVAE
jgi:hypothetical protein